MDVVVILFVLVVRIDQKRIPKKASTGVGLDRMFRIRPVIAPHELRIFWFE